MGKKYKNYIYNHLPWQVLSLTIFVFSSLPGDDLPDLGFRSADKLVHLLLFGTLAVLMLRSFESTRFIFIKNNAVILAIVGTILYGAMDEIHQYFTPGRSVSFLDWAADTAGAIILVLVYRLLMRQYTLFSENRKSG